MSAFGFAKILKIHLGISDEVLQFYSYATEYQRYFGIIVSCRGLIQHSKH